MSTIQKVTVVSCVCVCVALLLPKLLLSGGGGGGGGRYPTSAEGGGFPTMLQRKSVSAVNSAHHSEAVARAKGGTAAAGKSNLTGQIIPVYGFGILLYIIYIIYKITQRGNSSKSQEKQFTTTTSENMKRKITDFELFQLQERLKETEEVMERIVSTAQTHTQREECVSVDQEVLLLQLREITRVMQDGRLVDAAYSHTHEGDLFSEPEETLKHWSSHCCPVHQQTHQQTQRADRQAAEDTEPADRQTDSAMSNEWSDEGGEEEICMEMIEQSEDHRWNTSPSGDHVIRHRSGRGTS